MLGEYVNSESLLLMDVDDDMHLDLIWGDKAHFWARNSNGVVSTSSFIREQDFLNLGQSPLARQGNHSEGAAACDLDGDGTLDLLTFSGNQPRAQAYYHTGPAMYQWHLTALPYVGEFEVGLRSSEVFHRSLSRRSRMFCLSIAIFPAVTRFSSPRSTCLAFIVAKTLTICCTVWITTNVFHRSCTAPP